MEKVLLPVESIIDGTWASGAPPKEFHDFFLMKHMKWSWDDLEQTPLYVRRYCWDILQRQFEHEHDEAETQRLKSERARGGH